MAGLSNSYSVKQEGDSSGVYSAKFNGKANGIFYKVTIRVDFIAVPDCCCLPWPSCITEYNHPQPTLVPVLKNTKIPTSFIS